MSDINILDELLLKVKNAYVYIISAQELDNLLIIGFYFFTFTIIVIIVVNASLTTIISKFICSFKNIFT